jgi:hypothetical protein
MPEGGLPDVGGGVPGEPGERAVEDAKPEQAQIPTGAPVAQAIAALPRPEALDDEDEEGDDDGEGDEGPATAGSQSSGEPGKDAGPAADGRRRRRRRRRRGGRGRGEQKSGLPDAVGAVAPSPAADSGESGPPPASGGSEGAA